MDAEVFFPAGRDEKEWNPSWHVGTVVKYILTGSLLTSGPDDTHSLGSPCPLPSALLAGECSTGECNRL